MNRLSRTVAALAFAALPAFFTAAVAEEAAPVKGTITGVLTAADDAGYPMFSLTITPAGKEPVGFLMNNEEAEVAGQIGELVGKTVTAETETKPSTTVFDVTADGKSIAFPADQKPEVDTSKALSITGILSGAKEPTASDLPDELTVTAKDGAKVTFEWYVDETMAKHDGKEVTLVYVVDSQTNVTKIGPAS
ncbi:hypothetical protein sos41_31810 [Alphaproteobacteria bacterium SO-S41]|nr:hypothetical protein sos41_31810 [Alphaproteobacteria bacterium SO-S41]